MVEQTILEELITATRRRKYKSVVWTYPRSPLIRVANSGHMVLTNPADTQQVDSILKRAGTLIGLPKPQRLTKYLTLHTGY